MQSETVTNKDLRSFGFIMAGAISVLFGLFFPWVFEKAWPLWPWITAALFILPAVVIPVILKPVYSLWMKIGAVLGWLNTRIILALVFYALFTPYSLVLKLLGKDPMRRKLDSDTYSYRIESKDPQRENMEHPF